MLQTYGMVSIFHDSYGTEAILAVWTCRYHIDISPPKHCLQLCSVLPNPKVHLQHLKDCLLSSPCIDYCYLAERSLDGLGVLFIKGLLLVD